MYFRIIGIDLKMPLKTFTNRVDELCDMYEADYGVKAELTITPLQTKQGKQLYELLFSDTNLSGSDFTMYAYQGTTGNIEFRPIILGDVHCCKTTTPPSVQPGADDDMCKVAHSILYDICEENKGTLAYYLDNKPQVLSRGKPQAMAFDAIVDTTGKVYSTFDIDIADLSTDDASDNDNAVAPTVNFDVLLTTWTKQDTQAHAVMLDKNTSMGEKMDTIGLLLINKTINKEIPSNEFRQLFQQASLYGFSGTNPQITTFSKLLL